MNCIVYVDYENMSSIKELKSIDGRYLIFLGASQKSVPKELVLATSNHQVDWIEISGAGKNALDFHIAYYLSKNDGEEGTHHYILSKDKGFDPLVSHVNQRVGKVIVDRIVSLDDITQKDGTPAPNPIDRNVARDKYEKVKKNLSAIQGAKRPKSEKGLVAHIYTLSGGQKWTADEVALLVEELYREGSISKGANNRISYSI